jgi:hypothetical protein
MRRQKASRENSSSPTEAGWPSGSSATALGRILMFFAAIVAVFVLIAGGMRVTQWLQSPPQVASPIPYHPTPPRIYTRTNMPPAPVYPPQRGLPLGAGASTGGQSSGPPQGQSSTQVPSQQRQSECQADANRVDVLKISGRVPGQQNRNLDTMSSIRREMRLWGCPTLGVGIP